MIYLLDINVLLALNDMMFATLDGGIKGALLIPKDIEPQSVVREPAPAYGAAA